MQCRDTSNSKDISCSSRQGFRGIMGCRDSSAWSTNSPTLNDQAQTHVHETLQRHSQVLNYQVLFARMYREAANWLAREQACYLNIGEVDKLGLCDGLVCLSEHALLEQQPALLQVLLLAVLHFVQHICYVLVIVQQHVLVWVGLAHVSLVVHCLHHTAMLNRPWQGSFAHALPASHCNNEQLCKRGFAHEVMCSVMLISSKQRPFW